MYLLLSITSFSPIMRSNILLHRLTKNHNNNNNNSRNEDKKSLSLREAPYILPYEQKSGDQHTMTSHN